MLGAQGDDELLVSLLLAALVEHAHVRLAAVEGLGGLAETARQTVVDQSDLEHALERVQDRHLAARAGVRGDFDLIGGDGGVGGGLFSVRLLVSGKDHVSPFCLFHLFELSFSLLFLFYMGSSFKESSSISAIESLKIPRDQFILCGTCAACMRMRNELSKGIFGTVPF